MASEQARRGDLRLMRQPKQPMPELRSLQESHTVIVRIYEADGPREGEVGRRQEAGVGRGREQRGLGWVCWRADNLGLQLRLVHLASLSFLLQLSNLAVEVLGILPDALDLPPITPSPHTPRCTPPYTTSKSS
eukprot:1538810-Rhodomonas_salina.3